MKLCKVTWTELTRSGKEKKEQVYYKDLESAKRAKREIAMSSNVISEVTIIEGVTFGE